MTKKADVINEWPLIPYLKTLPLLQNGQGGLFLYGRKFPALEKFMTFHHIESVKTKTNN